MQHSMNDSRSRQSECDGVRYGERCTDEDRRVCLICILVEFTPYCLVENPGDIVWVGVPIHNGTCRYRHIRRVPNLIQGQPCSCGIDQTYIAVVQNRANDPVKDDEPGHGVGLRPPRNHEWRSDIKDLHPIKGEYTHAEAGGDAKQLVDDPRFCPAVSDKRYIVMRSVPGLIQQSQEK